MPELSKADRLESCAIRCRITQLFMEFNRLSVDEAMENDIKEAAKRILKSYNYTDISPDEVWERVYEISRIEAENDEVYPAIHSTYIDFFEDAIDDLYNMGARRLGSKAWYMKYESFHRANKEEDPPEDENDF